MIDPVYLVSVIIIGAIALHHFRERGWWRGHETNAAKREAAAAQRHAEMLASLLEGTRQMEAHAKAASVFAGRVATAHQALMDHEGAPILVKHTKRIENLEARLDEHLKDHD